MSNTSPQSLESLIRDYEEVLPTIALESVTSAKNALEAQIKAAAEKEGMKVTFPGNFKVALIED